MKKKERSKFVKIFDPHMWLYDFGKITSALFIWLWLRTKKIYINGKKPKGLFKGRYIIACNHVSLYDHFVIASTIFSRRICNVSTTNLTEGKFGWFFKAVGTIGIDKEHISIKAIKQIIDTLDRGHVICTFPQGSVSESDEPKDFKGGIAMMAAYSNSDILPIYLPKRKNIWHRRVAIIGEKIKCQDLFKNKIPTREEINNASILLIEKEKELEIKYKENNKKG